MHFFEIKSKRRCKCWRCENSFTFTQGDELEGEVSQLNLWLKSCKEISKTAWDTFSKPTSGRGSAKKFNKDNRNNQ